MKVNIENMLKLYQQGRINPKFLAQWTRNSGVDPIEEGKDWMKWKRGTLAVCLVSLSIILILSLILVLGFKFPVQVSSVLGILFCVAFACFALSGMVYCRYLHPFYECQSPAYEFAKAVMEP